MNAAFKKVRGAIGDADPALRDLIVQSIVELAEDSLGAGRYEKRIKRDGMIRGGGIITPIDHLPGSARPSRRPRHRHRRASSACRRGCSVAAMNEPPPAGEPMLPLSNTYLAKRPARSLVSPTLES